MDWVLIYSDLSLVLSDRTEWTDAPGWDVQIALFRDPLQDGLWTIRHGAAPDEETCDYYRLDEDGSVVGMSEGGFIGHVVNDLKLCEAGTPLEEMIRLAVHDTGLVKQGKMLSSAKWQEVLRYGMETRKALRQQDGRS